MTQALSAPTTAPAPAQRVRRPANRQANTTPTPTPPPAPTSPNAQAPQKNNWEKILELLKSKRDAIAKVIPHGVNLTADALIQNAIQQMLNGREQAKLIRCTPASVVYAVLASAAAGLDFANDESYLVPFERTEKRENTRVHVCWECRFMGGYKGYIKVAARHGFHLGVNVVYEGEPFRMLLGTANTVEHEAGFCCDPDKIVGSYAVVREKADGRVAYIERMGREEMDQIAAGSQSIVWKDKNRRGEMYRKTVCRRAFKWLAKSGGDLAVLQEAERRAETGESLEDLAKSLEDRAKKGG